MKSRAILAPLPVALLAAITLGATSCADQTARDAAARAQAAIDGAPESLMRLDAYLRAQYEWEMKLFDAVCQLEQRAVVTPPGLDPGKKICSSDPGGGLPPPKYPPQ